MKFSEYYLALTSGFKSTCAPLDDEGPELEGDETGNDEADSKLSKPIDHNYSDENVDLNNVKGILEDECPKERFTEATSLRPIHGETAQKTGNAPQNKLIKYNKKFR